jgi:hypothetical protein
MSHFKPLSLSRRRFLRTSAVASAAVVLRAFAADKLNPLFDGHSLTGWHKTTKHNGHGIGGQWTVENGLLVGQQDPPGSGNGGIFLTNEKFGDFELSLDMHPDWGPDSGVFFRCTEEGHGFQMFVDYHDGGNVGHLRGEMPGAFALKPFQIFAQPPGAKPAGFTTRRDPRAEKWPAGVYESSCTAEEWLRVWRLNDWNTARIRCVGKYPQITTWINDLRVCHWNGETCTLPEYHKERVFEILGREGPIGLQVHGGKAMWPKGTVCRWRNISIKRL